MGFLLNAFTDFSILMGNEFIFFIVVGAMVMLAERRSEKRQKILLAVIIASLAVIGLRHLFAVERPCMDEYAPYGCPDGPLSAYSFPSGHATIAFLVMIAFLDKPSFPFFWLFALLIAASRVFLGVHSFEDIAGAMVLAPIVYFATDALWRRYFEGNK